MSNNEKIANWMGLSKMPDGTWLDFIGNGEEGQLYSELLFDTSWDWLHPVIEKINNFDLSEFNNNVSKMTTMRLFKERVRALSITAPIKIVYDLVVEICDWYETQKP